MFPISINNRTRGKKLTLQFRRFWAVRILPRKLSKLMLASEKKKDLCTTMGVQLIHIYLQRKKKGGIQILAFGLF